MENYKKGGYEKRFIVTKANGEPTNPNADYFVLRLDKDPHALNALAAYAESVKADNPRFAGDLEQILQGYNHQAKHRNETPPKGGGEKNELAFLTWYEQITGETHHELDLEFDEDMLWHWRTWNEAIKTQPPKDNAQERYNEALKFLISPEAAIYIWEIRLDEALQIAAGLTEPKEQ